MSRVRNNLIKREKIRKSIDLIKGRRGRGIIDIKVTKKNKVKQDRMGKRFKNILKSVEDMRRRGGTVEDCKGEGKMLRFN